MADGPRIAVGPAKPEAALVGGDNSSGMIFTLILRCSNYALPLTGTVVFSPSGPFRSPAILICLMSWMATGPYWSVLVCTMRCGECSLARGVCSEMQEELNGKEAIERCFLVHRDAHARRWCHNRF